MRADGQKFGRDPHILLLFHHLPDCILVIKGFLSARLGALEQSVVALCIEKPLFVEARLLKTMIHIRGDNKIVLIPNQRQQIVIDRLRRIRIAVDKNIPAPIRPKFLLCGKRIKAAGIHIGKAVFIGKVGEILLKPFPGIDKTCRGGKSCACANYNGVRSVQRLPKAVHIIRYNWRVRGTRGRFRNPSV